MPQFSKINFSSLNLELEHDNFMQELLHHLTGVLQDVVGEAEAAGFISIVGQKMGDDINKNYRQALMVSNLNREQVTAAMVDLKRRIKGNFSLVSEDAEKIVLQTNSCPFAEKIIDRPSLCMMTSNVLGTIAAENLGYAKVHLAQTIAQGDAGCRVEIYLQHNDEAEAASGNEYYKG